jgi:hypothetical protein
MTAAATSTSTRRLGTAQARGRGHIGLLMLGSIACGLALGFLLVLAVFGGGTESQITGSALVALGAANCVDCARLRYSPSPC